MDHTYSQGVARQWRLKHPEAFWSAVLVFCTNLAAVEIVRFLGDNTATVLAASVFTSIFAALAIYAKVRLNDAKKEQESQPKKDQDPPL